MDSNIIKELISIYKLEKEFTAHVKENTDNSKKNLVYNYNKLTDYQVLRLSNLVESYYNIRQVKLKDRNDLINLFTIPAIISDEANKAINGIYNYYNSVINDENVPHFPIDAVDFINKLNEITEQKLSLDEYINIINRMNNIVYANFSTMKRCDDYNIKTLERLGLIKEVSNLEERNIVEVIR